MTAADGRDETPRDGPTLNETDAQLADRLDEIAGSISAGRRQWRMRVPVQADDDDMVLSQAADRLRALASSGAVAPAPPDPWQSLLSVLAAGAGARLHVGDIYLEEDGSVSIDWDDDDASVSVSIHSDGTIGWSALIRGWTAYQEARQATVTPELLDALARMRTSIQTPLPPSPPMQGPEPEVITKGKLGALAGDPPASPVTGSAE